MKGLLLPFSLLFFLVVQLRDWLYRLGILKSYSVDRPVICVGNLTTGGTGKTPWVQMICEKFQSENKKVAIISRGYSGQYEGILQVTEKMDPKKCGDEPLWLKQNTKAEVFLGANRVAAAQTCIDQVQPDVLILDDGFQHRRLKRNCDIVLLDASANNLHRYLIPMGFMREPYSALSRADVVVINKCNYATPEQVRFIEDRCSRFLDSKKIFHANYIFDQWSALGEPASNDLPLEGVSMTCGVGNPQAFLKTLESQKIQPVNEFIFPDHFYWKERDIEKMSWTMQEAKSHHLVMTEKDAVKLVRYKKHFQELSIQLWVCKMKVTLKGDESDFFKRIQAGLAQ